MRSIVSIGSHLSNSRKQANWPLARHENGPKRIEHLDSLAKLIAKSFVKAIAPRMGCAGSRRQRNIQRRVRRRVRHTVFAPSEYWMDASFGRPHNLAKWRRIFMSKNWRTNSASMCCI
jgi:hypothetical protein